MIKAAELDVSEDAIQLHHLKCDSKINIPKVH